MTIRGDRAALFLDERLTNEAGEDLDVLWGHHVAFGRPFLDPGACIYTSARTILAEDELPDYGPASHRAMPDRGPWSRRRTVPPRSERRPGTGLSQRAGEVLPVGLRGGGLECDHVAGKWLRLRWDVGLFKYLWLWQEFASGAGYPWWKRTYTVALEPWTSYPTPSGGTQLVLPAGGSVETSLVAVGFVPDGEVTGVGFDGAVTFGPPSPGTKERRN